MRLWRRLAKIVGIGLVLVVGSLLVLYIKFIDALASLFERSLQDILEEIDK